MRKKTFILGVGCQKGGTTWLHSQLNDSPEVDMGLCKEYHVFDALYVDDCKDFLTNKLKRLGRINNCETQEQLSEFNDLLLRVSFYADTKNYFNYFDFLWRDGGPLLSAVGDITPTYALLPKHALEEIKAGLEAKGFEVKVIFLMRDPIERIWSALRMARNHRAKSGKEHILSNERDHLMIFSENSINMKRSDYETTIKNLETVFDRNDIFYTFYEKLFMPNTLLEMKNFLGLEDFNPDVNYKINISGKSKTMKKLDPELGAKLFEQYKSTYDFCEERFGVKDFWPGWDYRII